MVPMKSNQQVEGVGFSDKGGRPNSSINLITAFGRGLPYAVRQCDTG